MEVGEIIMSHRKNAGNFSIKSDNTPVTQADKASNELIINTLKKITPNIPILSEESSNIPFSIRKSRHEYWLIDPLDGTREFIDGTPDFCIGIALLRNHYADFALIYQPLQNVHQYTLLDK